MKFDEQLQTLIEEVKVGSTYPAAIEIIRTIKHPNYINFSDSFKKALKAEVERIKTEHPEKHDHHVKNAFLKAIRFYI